MPERRSEPRRLVYKSVEFTLKGDSYPATVINVSDSGLGLYVFIRLNEGDEIRINGDIPTRHRVYAVRWVTELLEDFFMAGLRCKENPGTPQARGALGPRTSDRVP